MSILDAPWDCCLMIPQPGRKRWRGPVLIPVFRDRPPTLQVCKLTWSLLWLFSVCVRVGFLCYSRSQTGHRIHSKRKRSQLNIRSSTLTWRNWSKQVGEADRLHRTGSQLFLQPSFFKCSWSRNPAFVLTYRHLSALSQVCGPSSSSGTIYNSITPWDF